MIDHSDILRVLKDTSRTFFIPIARLPVRLQEAVGAAYLCMRAIDEIEDHPTLESNLKSTLLHKLSWALQSQLAADNAPGDSLRESAFGGFEKILPEVTLRIGDWLAHAPLEIAPRIWDATIAMADRMAYWVENDWQIHSEADLDSYTFSVAGAVGLLICDIWAWFDGSQVDRLGAIHFGRGLQSVNILRNKAEDQSRGVDFFPEGWENADMFAYARRNLEFAKESLRSIPQRTFRQMVDIPLALAEATLAALENGQTKLTRAQVLRIVGEG